MNRRRIRGGLFLCSVALAASPRVLAGEDAARQDAPKEEAPRTAEWLEVKGTRFRPYGFPRLDVIYTDSRLSPSNQTPFFAFSEDSSVQAKENDEELDIHPRLSRLGIDVERDSIPRWESAKVSGKIEIDFQNGGSESREAVRMRHAYLKIEDASGFSVLGGQTWDLISPLLPSANGDSLMWNAGNLGDRRPQLRLGYETALGGPGKLDLAGAVARTGAINNRDLDGDGTADGIDSGLPMLQARIGVSDLLGGAVQGGVWGHFGWEDVDLGVAGEREFTSGSIGADLLVRLTGAVSAAAEIWTGRNLDDVRGGVGQGVNATAGDEIHASGGWAEVRCKLLDGYTPAAGFTIDDPRNGDLDPATTTGGGPRERNVAFYLANHVDLGGGLNFGLEYIYWKTEYGLGLDDGDANRINFWMSLRF